MVEVLHPRIVFTDLESIVLDEMGGQFGQGLVAVALGVLYALVGHALVPLGNGLEGEGVRKCQRCGLHLLIGQPIPFLLGPDGVGLEGEHGPFYQRGIVLHQHQFLLEGGLQRGVDPVGSERAQVHRHHDGLDLAVLGDVLEQIVIHFGVGGVLGDVATSHLRHQVVQHLADFPMVGVGIAVGSVG